MRCIALVVCALIACGTSEPAKPAGEPTPAPAPQPVAALGEDKPPPGEAACKQACAHRATCIPSASDQGACLADCSALTVLLGDKGIAAVEAYAAADCASVQQQEPGFQQASACLGGCKHVLACGVAGTFPGCMAECAQNLEKKALTLEQIAAITTADCNTVKASVKLASAPADTSACTAACRNYERCGMQPFDACMKECPEVDPSRLPMFAGASCEQLKGGDFGAQGFGCMREGRQDCMPGMMCCVAHRASMRGEQGRCLYAALCYHRGF